MERIGFTLMHLYEETQKNVERFVSPQYETFIDLPDSFHILIDNCYYEVSVQKNEQYIWLAFNFGSPTPRDENLTNITTGDKKSNPRENIEAELLKQLFCLYHYSNETLYLSNSKKKKLIELVFKEKIEKDFTVKSFFKTKEEFIELLATVEEITFTEARNLFNTNSKQRQALIDLTGTDAPDNFSITAGYPKAKLLKGFLADLFHAKSKHSLKDLIVRGTDEEKFSVIFNNDTFIKKINIPSRKNENGKFDSEDVKLSLLKEIDV